MEGMAKQLSILALLFILFTLGACARAEKFEYRSNRELKQGPGLLTGKEGAIVIYRK